MGKLLLKRIPMTKLELKGRLLDVIAQIQDKSNLDDLYRFAQLLLDNEESNASSSKTIPLESPGPASRQAKPNDPSDHTLDELPPSKYFSY